MIKLQNITKKFENNTAIEDASFIIEKDKINCFVGRNGAGKTTLIKIILKQIIQDSGTINYEEKLSPHDISYLAEERGLYTKNTVTENIGYFCDLSGCKNKKQRISEVLNEFEITDYANTKISKLSKGNAQKVQLACIFAPNSKLIILDEPFSGLDYINSIKLAKIIKKYAKDKYMLISTHQMKFVDDFADNLLVVSDGKVKFSGSVEELKINSNIYFILDNNKTNIDILEENKLQYLIKEQKLFVNNINKLEVLNVIKNDKIKTFNYDYLKSSDIIIELVGEKYE